MRKVHKYTKSSDQDMQGIVDQVNNRDADIDLAVFLGTNHIKLMKMLNNKTNIFKIPYTTLISKAEMGNIDLRLDTNVVSIDEFRDTYCQAEIFHLITT